MAAINSCPFCDELKVFDSQCDLTRHLSLVHMRAPALHCYRRESAFFASLVVCRAPACRAICSTRGFSKHWTRQHAQDPALRHIGIQKRSLDSMTNEEIEAIPTVQPALPILPNLGGFPDSDSEPDEAEVADLPVVGLPVAVVADLPEQPANVPPPLIFPDAHLKRLRRFFNTGLFRIHYQHEAALRLVVFRLIQRITGSVDQDQQWHQSHVCALLILPGVVHRLMILKRPSLRQFFRDCEASPNGESRFILQLASTLMEASLAQPAQRRDATGGLSQGAFQRKTKRTIEQLFRDGRIGPATSILESAVPHLEKDIVAPRVTIPLEVVRAEIERLNPAPTDADVLPDVPLSAIQACDRLKLDAEVVRETLSLLPVGSCNGTSGWTYALIRRLFCSSSAKTEHLEVLALMFRQMASGRMPNTQWIESRAVLLPKGEDKFRPLGIGETWYRVLTRTLLRIVGPGVGLRLAPLQFGCGIAGGCEIAGRLTAFLSSVTEGQVVIKTDFTNAFNTTPRAKIFHGLSSFAPSLLPFFQWAYGGASELVDSKGNQVGQSSTGCRQGDPLAALFFCVAIQDTIKAIDESLKEVCAETSVAWVGSYMDDISVVVPETDAMAICQRIITLCHEAGLPLNINKCRVLGSHDSQLPFPILPEGDVVLGNPVGSTDFCRRHFQDLVHHTEAVVTGMSRLKLSSRASFQLLRQAINPRAGFLVRVCEEDMQAELQAFDQVIDDGLWLSCGHIPALPSQHPSRSGLSACIRSLPLSLGGLGIARYSWIAGQMGRAMSRRLLLHFVDSTMPTVAWRGSLRKSLPTPDFGACCPLVLALPETELNHIVELNADVQDSYNSHSDDVIRDVPLYDIRNITYGYHAAAVTHLLESQYSVAQAAWFASSQFAGSGRWLTSPTGVIQPPALTLSDSEFHAALRMRLLLDLSVHHDGDVSPDRCRCDQLVNPLEPLHVLDEPANKPLFIVRHNVCRDLIMKAFRKHSGIRNVEPEPVLPNQNNATPEQRLRADILVSWKGQVDQITHSAFLDIAVGNPAAPTYRMDDRNDPITRWHFWGACTHRHREKLAKYEPFTAATGLTITPLAMDASGRLGPHSFEFLEKAFARSARFDQVTPLVAKLSIACMKVNAQMVNQSIHALARAARRREVAI
jgi:hypothetical protein